jgi:hypothetical protein
VAFSSSKSSNSPQGCVCYAYSRHNVSNDDGQPGACPSCPLLASWSSVRLWHVSIDLQQHNMQRTGSLRHLTLGCTSRARQAPSFTDTFHAAAAVCGWRCWPSSPAATLQPLLPATSRLRLLLRLLLAAAVTHVEVSCGCGYPHSQAVQLLGRHHLAAQPRAVCRARRWCWWWGRGSQRTQRAWV